MVASWFLRQVVPVVTSRGTSRPIYSVGRNRFYSVDSMVGAILSDFALHSNTLSTTRMGVNADDPKPVTLSLNRWR